MTKQEKFWIALLILVMSFGLVQQCAAQTKKPVQIDTVYCNISNIDKYISITKENGKQKTYAIYKDVKNNIQELILVSQSVIDYIKLCEQNGIMPNLGIRVRNGQISSIIRLKRKIK